VLAYDFYRGFIATQTKKPRIRSFAGGDKISGTAARPAP
jgi:hypothetical protein